MPVQSLTGSVPSICPVVPYRPPAPAAPLPLVLVAGRAPATAVAVVVVVALAAAAEISVVGPAPPMDPENPTGWTPPVAAAQTGAKFALPLLPIELLLLLQLPPPLQLPQLPTVVDSIVVAVPTDPPVTATVQLASAVEAGFAAPLLQPLLPQLPAPLLLLLPDVAAPAGTEVAADAAAPVAVDPTRLASGQPDSPAWQTPEDLGHFDHLLLVRAPPERICICSACSYHCYHEICIAVAACAAVCEHPQLLSYLLLHALHEVG